MKRHYLITGFLCLLLALPLGANWQSAAAAPAAPTDTDFHSPAGITHQTRRDAQRAAPQAFTVSGTIRDPAGAAVPEVSIGVSSAHEWDEDITDGNGFYSVQVSGPTWLRFYIEPPVATRLAQRIVYLEGPFSDNTTLDFDLMSGHLFAGEVQGLAGESVYLPWGGDVIALTNPPPENESYSFWTNWRDGTFQTVLPTGVYSIIVRDPPRPYYPTAVQVDLRAGDMADYDFILNTVPHPLPGTEPPDATRISLGTPDPEGYLSVTAAAGAVSPFAAVVIAHLTSGRWTSTVADEEGSFTATAYGPPGSTLIIKQDPTHRYTNDFLKHSRSYDDDSGPISSSSLDSLASTTLLVPMPGLPKHRSGYEPDKPAPLLTEIQGSAILATWPLAGSGIINPWDGVAMWRTSGQIAVEDTMQRVLSGTLNAAVEPGLYAGGIHWSRPALADLDGDGDQDLLVGHHSGRIFHYRNDGLRPVELTMPLASRPANSAQLLTTQTVELPRWTFVTDQWENMDISWLVSPAFVDIDDDGDLDLLAGAGNGSITFFRNIGTPTTPAWRYVTDEYAGIDVGSYSAPAFADIDADRDYDLLIGNGDGRVALYRNIGSRQEAIWMLVSDDILGMSVGWMALPALADIDADGDLDLFVGTWGQISHWRNDGDATRPAWTLVTHAYANINEEGGGLLPVFSDLDSDGDLDLLLGSEYGPMRTYSNMGTPANPVWAGTMDDSLPLDLGGYSTPALGDWDADGDLDLLVGEYHSQVHILRNDGQQSGQPAWVDVGLVAAVDPDTQYHAAPALVDIDDDGDLDLFVGEDDGTLDFLRNLGTPTRPNWTLAASDYGGFDVGSRAKPTFGDLDDDGDYDLLLGASDGRLHYFENTGTARSPSWADPDDFYGGFDVGNSSAPRLADLDGDQDLDLLIGDDDGRLWALERNGDGWSLLASYYGAVRAGEHTAPAAGDLNNDGRPDLLVGSVDGGLQLYLDRGAEPRPAGLQPGGAVTASGMLTVTSTAIPPGADPEQFYLGANFELHPFFDATGRPHSIDSQFSSTFLTPTGFPVERYASWYNPWGTYFEMTNKRLVDDHTLVADYQATLYLPDDLPAGWYRPVLELHFGQIPAAPDEAVASVASFNRGYNLAYGPVVAVGEPATPHLPWLLLADTLSNATRGAAAAGESAGHQLANRRIYQGAAPVVPRTDPRSELPLTYRLEPFVPFLSMSDHSLPYEPLIPLAFPSGQLHVTVEKPDGTIDDLGTAPFVQSTSRTPVMLNGDHYEGCSGSVGDIYQLTTGSGQFDYQFEQEGRHRITMTGTVEDIWGNSYTGGGTYEVIVGREIHIHPGAIPGTPFQVGDALAPTLRLSPAVPADVTLRWRLYRNSDPADVVERVITGRANDYGYFHPGDVIPLVFDAAGEYRVDVTAVYTDDNDVVWAGSLTWGNVVETPGTRLVAHGRRGIDESYTRTQWFRRDSTGVHGGAINFPFANGDIVWSTDSDKMAAKVTVHDPDGLVTQVLRERAALTYPAIRGPGNIENRIAMGEAPLFSVAAGPSDPAYTLNPMEQWGYTYRVAQRPGISVHQHVTEDSVHAPIWQFGNRHGSQIGMGMDGERTNDFKWQFGGVVLRDLVEGWSQYAIYGSLWVNLPADDPLGSRVMPPFQGAAGGPSGGPLLTLAGENVDLFIEPTGVKPGAVLQVGDTFAFAGQVAPPLASRVDVTVISPGGATHEIAGRANKVGYFYDPADDFIVDEPGVWTVAVTVTHDGMTSAGPVDPPYPTGGVLSLEANRYHFYVVDADEPRATLHLPEPGWVPLEDDWNVQPLRVLAPVPPGWTDVSLHYTIAMPGWILESGELPAILGFVLFEYDPETLRDTFPNIDLRRRQGWSPGLSDEVFISLIVSGNVNGQPAQRANVVTLHGEQVLFDGYEELPGPLPLGASGAAGGDYRLFLASIVVGSSQALSSRPPWCREGNIGNCQWPVPAEQPVVYPSDDAPVQNIGRIR